MISKHILKINQSFNTKSNVKTVLFQNIQLSKIYRLIVKQFYLTYR